MKSTTILTPPSTALSDILINFYNSPNRALGMSATVLPAKSDSDIMFYLQSNQGLSIDRSLVYLSYPQDKINAQEISQFAFAQEEWTSKSFT